MSQDRLDPGRREALRAIPSIDALLRTPGLEDLPRPLLAREARAWLDECRSRALAGALSGEAAAAAFEPVAACRELEVRCTRAAQRRHRPVLNATGIVLHTGIGRARLPDDVAQAMAEAAGFAIVEVDPTTGQRDQRECEVSRLLCEQLGVEGALVVNNNAAAITLALAALTAGQEVVVSRGEQVEIGGGFRMPEVMAQAGCHMVEVGATNRTHLRDYVNAMHEGTAALLKVHPSNYRIEGFFGMPPMADLVAATRPSGVMVIEDLGSGLILRRDQSVFGLVDEPRVIDSVLDGVDVITFSGDKLMGGPQAGFIIGRRDLVAQVRAHPLYRAFRCDKTQLAGIEATLRLYRDGDPLRDVPTLRMLDAGVDELRERATVLAGQLAALGAEVVESDSFAGSGANPARPIPSVAVALPGGDATCDALRQGPAGIVFARVAQDRTMLDQRTLLLEDLERVAAMVNANLEGCRG